MLNIYMYILNTLLGDPYFFKCSGRGVSKMTAPICTLPVGRVGRKRPSSPRVNNQITCISDLPGSV